MKKLKIFWAVFSTDQTQHDRTQKFYFSFWTRKSTILETFWSWREQQRKLIETDTNRPTIITNQNII